MPTIGELLAEIRNGGMNAEGTGTSPYGGEVPGTNDPTAQPGLDDIGEDTRASIGDYLSQKTKGLERLEEKNMYPIEPDLSSIALTDSSTGNPSPLTTINEPQEAFIDPVPDNFEELQIKDGFEILKQLGFFEDLEGSDGPTLDKNSQTDGHTLLNRTEVRTKVSNILTTSRFSALTNPDAPFSERVDLPEIDFLDDTGAQKDHPQLEKIKEIARYVVNTGKPAKEAYPDSRMVKARDPASVDPNTFGESSNLEYGESNPEPQLNTLTGEPVSGAQHVPDLPYGIDHNDFGEARVIAQLEIMKTLLEPAMDLLNGLFGLFSLNGVYVNQPHSPTGLRPGRRFGFGGFTPPTGINFGATPDVNPNMPIAANAGYKFLQALGIPLPRNIILASGVPAEIATKLLEIAISGIEKQIQNDASSISFFNSVTRRARGLLSIENNFGLPVIPSVPLQQLPGDAQFMQNLSQCPAMKFIRAMAIIAESLAAGSQSVTAPNQSTAGLPFRFSGVGNLNKLKNSPVNRHAGARIHGYPGNSLRNMPSLMLLPTAFQAGVATYRADGASISIALSPNTQTHDNYLNLLSTAGPTVRSGIQGNHAASSKLGVPKPPAGGMTPTGLNANRFSREEVEAIENMLEAEHVPFYFHDLRTNEIVSFHAFLNALSDSFSPQYNSSSGFGRIEDVQIYSKTQRQIQVDFSLMAYTKADMKEMYFKMNKLIAMVYPQFSRGTMLEHKTDTGVTRFVQPFSQVTTATPIIRLRVGDLIKSNYSREGIARLMGVSDPNFQVLGDPDPTTIEGFSCAQAVAAVVAETSAVPLTATGEHDADRGWPVGSVVILDPPYNPLVDFDPESSTVGSDWSATISEGNIGVKILSYHAFSNPLGGTNPNQEEIVIKVAITNDGAAAPFFPSPNTHIAVNNTTGEQITEAFLSYRDINTELSAELICYGINDHLERLSGFAVTSPAEIPAEPPTDTEINNMRDRLFGDKNPIMRSFETTAGRGLAGVITSLNFDWGLNDTINWDTRNFGYKAPKGCKISISFTPIHDITPGLDNDGMIRAPVFNVAGSSPHNHEDVHPRATASGGTVGGYDRRSDTYHEGVADYLDET